MKKYTAENRLPAPKLNEFQKRRITRAINFQWTKREILCLIDGVRLENQEIGWNELVSEQKELE